jgi:hypothetical protein
VPLVATDTIPKIGTRFLTDDGTEDGTPFYVEWVDWQSRDNPLNAITVADDGSSIVEVEAIGRTGIITLLIKNCPKARYLELRQDKNTGGHYTAVLPYPSEPDVLNLDIEYLSIKARDGAYLATEPVEDVVLSLWCHGAAS